MASLCLLLIIFHFPKIKYLIKFSDKWFWQLRSWYDLPYNFVSSQIIMISDIPEMWAIMDNLCTQKLHINNHWCLKPKAAFQLLKSAAILRLEENFIKIYKIKKITPPQRAKCYNRKSNKTILRINYWNN